MASSATPLPSRATSAGERLRLFRRRYLWGYLFVLPALSVFAVFFVYPLIWAFVLGFQKFDVFRSDWVGLRNYAYVLQDPIYQKAFVNTVVYTLSTVPTGIAIALLLASAIFRLRSSGMQNFYKAAFYDRRADMSLCTVYGYVTECVHNDKPIVTEISPAAPFYAAEEYHQKYYQKRALHYKMYRAGSGRQAYIETTWGEDH